MSAELARESLELVESAGNNKEYCSLVGGRLFGFEYCLIMKCLGYLITVVVKHAVGTPKHISDRVKEKGLQKRRWFCQMGQKECCDQNGFKCHMVSETYQWQLRLFIDTYVCEFCKELLKTSTVGMVTKRLAVQSWF
jgi:hypothetical protein